MHRWEAHTGSFRAQFVRCYRGNIFCWGKVNRIIKLWVMHFYYGKDHSGKLSHLASVTGFKDLPSFNLTCWYSFGAGCSLLRISQTGSTEYKYRIWCNTHIRGAVVDVTVLYEKHESSQENGFVNSSQRAATLKMLKYNIITKYNTFNWFHMLSVKI